MIQNEIVSKYFQYFYEEFNAKELEKIFDENLLFDGPYNKFASSKDYIDALNESPPANMNYEVLYEFKKDNNICIVYNFIKESVKIRMAQIFSIKDKLIIKILLIFDTESF